jgi:alkylation response protein AidB-like acyl-CoA dehydrogenase
VLARTDPTQPKHRGITMFVVDMHAPGVTVRPLRVATGAAPFNEVFFDSVRLPADAVIGERNRGWDAAVVMLRAERITIGTMGSGRGNPLGYEALRDLARRLGRLDDPAARRRLAELYARQRATALFGRTLREEALAGRSPGARGSMAKLANAELGTFAGIVAQDVLGDALAGHETGDDLARVVTSIIGSTGSSIAGGTNEIQRNIIGERVLGLAKDPGVDRQTTFNQLRVGTQKREGSS